MLNNVDLMGRMVNEPQESESVSENGTKRLFARYRIAVERDYKVNGKRPVDYINCSAADSTAEYAIKYFRQGYTVVVSGRIYTEKYQKKGSSEDSFYMGIQVRYNYLVKRTENQYEHRNEPEKIEQVPADETELPQLPQEYME